MSEATDVTNSYNNPVASDSLKYSADINSTISESSPWNSSDFKPTDKNTSEMPYARSNNEINQKRRADSPHQIVSIQAVKEQGDQYFIRKEYNLALESYSRSLSILREEKKPTERELIVFSTKILANISQCLLKLNRFEESLFYNKQILFQDPTYVKAYYRAGVALCSLNRHEEALEILTQGLPIVKQDQDQESIRLFVNLYNEVVRTCNKNREELKGKLRNFYQPKVKDQKPTPQAWKTFRKSSVVGGLPYALLGGLPIFLITGKLPVAMLSFSIGAIGYGMCQFNKRSRRGKALLLVAFLVVNCGLVLYCK